MANYILSCCSTADLSQEHFRDRDIHYVCFHYYLNGKPYTDDLGQSMPFDKFYQAMVDGAETSTSQVNADEFEAFWAALSGKRAGCGAYHAVLGYQRGDQLGESRQGAHGS